MRKTRCDREEGFTKGRKPRDMSKRAAGRDGGTDRRTDWGRNEYSRGIMELEMNEYG